MRVVAKASLPLQTALVTSADLFTVPKDGDYLLCGYLSTSGPASAGGTIGLQFQVVDNYGNELVPARISIGYAGGLAEGESVPVHAIAGSTIKFSTTGNPPPSGSSYGLFLSVVNLPDPSDG